MNGQAEPQGAEDAARPRHLKGHRRPAQTGGPKKSGSGRGAPNAGWAVAGVLGLGLVWVVVDSRGWLGDRAPAEMLQVLEEEPVIEPRPGGNETANDRANESDESALLPEVERSGAGRPSADRFEIRDPGPEHEPQRDRFEIRDPGPEHEPEAETVRQEPPARTAVSQPSVLERVQPVYPEQARRARIQGIVILKARISETGVVTDVEVLRGIALLTEAAVTAVRQWRYRPAMRGNTPVATTSTVTVNFTLDEGP